LTITYLNYSLAKDHSPCKDSLRPGISAPQNTPNPSAASGNSSSTKKQRRSVVEAGKAAHVKQKVALFENLKGQHVGSNSSSSTSSITTIATTTTTSTTSNSSSSSSSSSSYHAVFPGLNLGDASTMTMARNFIITIPRISEEAEDEMVALGEFSHEEGEEGDEVGEGKRMNQGVGTTTTARVLDMNDDEQFLPPSYGQWEGRQQKGKAGAAVEAAAAAAPSAAGLVTSTQQITLALKDLRLNGPSSDALQQQELQQDQPNGFKADVRVGGEENNQAAAGPAPIIECNRKLAIPCSHPQQQQQDIADSSCGSSSGPVGVLLGVFQKTLGLGKHHQRGSVPPVSPSSSLVGTAAAAAVSMAAPTMTTDALDSLPPIDAEDTYLMSESDEEGRSGGGGGGGKGFSDSEEEEEEELNRKRRATKKVRMSRGGGQGAITGGEVGTDSFPLGFCMEWWRLWSGGAVTECRGKAIWLSFIHRHPAPRATSAGSASVYE